MSKSGGLTDEGVESLKRARVKRFDRGFVAYVSAADPDGGCTIEANLEYLLTDMLHFCALNEYDFDSLLERARYGYAEELEDYVVD